MADRAGVRLSLVHYHFGSRQGLLAEVLLQENDLLLERQRELYAAPGPLAEKWRTACEFLDEDIRSGYVRVLWELWAAGLADPALAAGWRAAMAGWRDLLESVFAGNGSTGSTTSWFTPVIQALPLIAGTIAVRSPTLASETTRPSNVDPITEAWLIESPTPRSPRAWRAAIRALRPVPVADRSRRPGATTTAFLDTAPTPRHGSAIWTMLMPAMPGFSGWAHGSCSRAATRISSPTRAEPGRLRRLEREPERGRVGDRVPHAPVGHVDGQRPEPFDLEARIERAGEAGDVRQLDALALPVRAPAVTSITPAGA